MAIRKAKNGGWIVDVSNGVDPITLNQRRIVRKGFKTKKEAIEAEQYIRGVELKSKISNGRITIDMLYQLLKQEDVINHRKQSYINTQDNNYNRHIKDYFLKVIDVSRLDYDDIYKFREYLRNTTAQNSNEPLNPNTINKIMVLLKKILDIGIKKGYYTNNPVKMLKKLPIAKAQLNYWSIEEFKEFLNLFEPGEYNYQLLFTCLFFTGMRLGEALALTWNDIEFTTQTIHITKSIYISKGISYLSTTKTKAGMRRITIHKKLNDELKEWKKTQYKLLNNFIIGDINELQIFQNSPMGITKNATEKLYKKILKRDPNIKRIRIHDFRHSHASLLINQGEDYLVVKERLGHASITTTIDTYSHLYPSKQKSLADKLDNLI
ncbi:MULTISPECIES: tyrosine-type recombinase/integrase [Streptococcus]|uniref:Site-specific recombinase, phage integrase family n=1 Tax=Streptococcus porcinus TaxID=1340 RepID=A0A4V0GXW8_STRPO|nr:MULTISPECIES: tyrosine-type recombinase/integrase [Streptococcus]QCK44879.1 site-specific integrase [Streptococcus pyogenes]VGR68723.1 site-specific recombinase, phage integrase family [Streptococcus pyogenes]VGV58237.1 site-specific recombinase, phage integrase family [Streptococcus pyogenes]VGV66646.1 site-specific recombinase, phage integrase family [Streptococcus pyogenes]VGW26731.1 site-specific recombinase, phage integrase family [Streptococcus pyogenes]